MLKETTTLEFGEKNLVDASLSETAHKMAGSEILKIASDIRGMVAAGAEICNLTVGDFDSRYFPIPSGFADRIRQAVSDGQTNYPPSDGVLALREAVAAYVARSWGVAYPVESVLIASGARPILYGAYRCVTNPGDRVVYPVPSWNNNHYSVICNTESVVVKTRPEDGFMPTLEQLAPHLSDARMLCLNSPLNPTGTVIDEAHLRDITGAVVEENRRRTKTGKPALFLLHDQIYASLVFGASRHYMPVELVPEAAPWVISVDGVSKGFAATGLRVGWLLAAPELTHRMKALIGHVGAWAPKPEQVALAAFLNADDEVRTFQKEMAERVRQRLSALYTGFKSMHRDGYPVDCIAPQGAIYLSLQLNLVGRSAAGRSLTDNDAIRKLLLDEAGLAVVPFQAFGYEGDTGWFRLSVGAVSMEEIESSFPRIRKLLDTVE
ncbi:MAG: aminotransferase class I/II-fold pyridoxal phosphate-dependent enzyme [Acidobacteriota bacterium]|nr:aminotransferase class I/II-fold pyridoxal phosphate-dependent enzyme [Acidobacteriota bacterium]MDH3785652.1 aminotransferase class I/II-fold pyridoxal phosphate-dependent enzyme [Acidobacteriota bacterium]